MRWRGKDAPYRRIEGSLADFGAWLRDRPERIRRLHFSNQALLYYRLIRPRRCLSDNRRYAFCFSQGPGEAEFMPIRVGQMKETLTPWGITWRSVRSIAVRDDTSVQSVDIRHVEDDATPPCPVSPFGLDGEVQIARSHPKTGEGCVLASTDEIEAQRGVETDCTGHIMGRQCDRTDALDHRGDVIRGCRKSRPPRRIHDDIPRSGQNPKILGRDDTEVIRYLITIGVPFSGHLLAQEGQDRGLEVGECCMTSIVGDVLVHQAP